MPLRLNQQLTSAEGSPIRRFAALARDTPGCVSLTLGEPGESTPDNISAQVTRDLAAGATHYPPNAGTPELRAAIAAYERAHGVAWATAEDVVVTIGATEALSSCLTALVEPDDEVIIVKPAFTLYESLVDLHAASPVSLDISRTDFQVRADGLARVIGPKTKAIIVCSPNNPTGCTLDAESLDAIAEAALRDDFYVICDDVYAELVYTSDFQRLASRHQSLSDRIVVVGSLSKPWAMTGWRLGWALSRDSIRDAIAKAHQLTVSCVPAPLQGAAVVALSAPVDEMRATYAARRAIVTEALDEMGLQYPSINGAFYAFPRIADLGVTDVEFCERAIRDHGVGLVPGSCFGGKGHVRISYACDSETLRTGLARMAGLVNELRG